jgi:hypothetical protein
MLTSTETVGGATRFKVRAPDGRVVAEATLEAGLPDEPFVAHLLLGVAAALAAGQSPAGAPVAGSQFPSVLLGPPQ